MKLILENRETNKVRIISEKFNYNVLWNIITVIGYVVLGFKKEFRIVGGNFIVFNFISTLLLSINYYLIIILVPALFIYLYLLGVHSNKMLIKGYLIAGYEITNEINNKPEIFDTYKNYQIPAYFLIKN